MSHYTNLISAKSDWTWNRIYQGLHENAIMIVRRDVCMKFYDAARLLYLETDVSGIGFEARFITGKEHHELLPW